MEYQKRMATMTALPVTASPPPACKAGPSTGISSRFYWIRGSCHLLLFTMLLPGLANAAISINHTRLIITEHERESSPRILNEGTQPVLIQAWMDTGDPDVQVERIRAPFIVDPPMFRLEPGQSRRLRVLALAPQEPLPDDRESLFWLNVLEVPPKVTGREGRNRLLISFQTRIKVFYRPDAIAKHAASPLSFFLEAKGGDQLLGIHNPAPVYRTLSTLAAVAADGSVIELESVMLSPRQTIELPLRRTGAPPYQASGLRIRYATIDDAGVTQQMEAPVYSCSSDQMNACQEVD